MPRIKKQKSVNILPIGVSKVTSIPLTLLCCQQVSITLAELFFTPGTMILCVYLGLLLCQNVDHYAGLVTS